MLKKIEAMEPEWLRKIYIPDWLVLVLALAFFLRIPTLFEPFYEKTEINILNNFSFLNIFWLKAILTAWLMATTLIFWKLNSKLFAKRPIMATTATVAYAVLTTLPTWGGNLASYEIFGVGLIILILNLVISPVIKSLNIFGKRLTKPFIFSSLWLLVSVLFILISKSFYPQALMLTVPTVSILIAILLASTKIDQSLTLIPLFILMLVIMKFNFSYFPTFSYYQNFTNYILGNFPKEEYFKYFSKNTSANYKISEFVVNSCSKENEIFVWGDSPEIYTMTKKLTPSLDIEDRHSVLTFIDTTKPKFVIVFKDSPDFRALDHYLIANYLQIQDIDGAKIWKSVENISALR